MFYKKKADQRKHVYIKFCCKLGKIAAGSYEMLKLSPGEEVVSRT
jgi:hypothetical protein